MVLTRSKAKQHIGDANENPLEAAEDMWAMRASSEHGADPALEDLKTVTQVFGITKDDASRSNSAKSTKRRKKSKAHSNNEETLNPKLWGTLPRELLQPIFTRLPVNEISRLQFLNKEWNQSVRTASSTFFRDCDDAYPQMLCFVTQENDDDTVWVRTLDMKRNNWYTYKIPMISGRKFAKSKHGVGLVCCYSEEILSSGRRSVNVSLVNPLTRVWHHLPPLFGVQAKCVELLDDPQRKAVLVTVVSDEKNGRMNKSDDEVLHLYDSLKGQWSTALPSSHQSAGNTWQVYDFEDTEQSFILYGSFSFGGLSKELSSKIISYVFYKDLCFVLRQRYHAMSMRHYIEEFRKVEGTDPGTKAKFKRHKCDPFEQLHFMPLYNMELYACEGFLMAVVVGFSHHHCFEKEIGWLYDLSTCKWSPLGLPELPGYRKPSTKCGLLLKPKWALRSIM